MKRFLVLALLASQAGAASPLASVRVQVEGSAALTFNHRAQNTLTLRTPWGTQQAVFSGTPYAPDPGNYWGHLSPLTLKIKLPEGVAAGRYPVSVSANLYLCDQRAHLCTVRTAQASGEMTVGQASARLDLLLTLPTFTLLP
ncbi:hypothetical protein [Deinococcus ruber]|uniref:Thiol:disulfide interchange protein DsbD N-terminal domain-containing protein n=1 Tax=Deinococcus ruber TaxID=1848197 RepID=A0A918BXR6_9DEIO|nr:hypothetical protein [Deinococcus ruber]GGQ95418.1 hypothetical protein GCM10008957_04770 [Deinococcus ruber]